MESGFSIRSLCGVKTNVVTAVEIAGRDSHDSPQSGPLFEATRRGFAE
jgi:hypothetical protein